MRCRNRFKKWLYLFLEKLLGKITTKLVTVSNAEVMAATRYGIIPGHKCLTVRNGLSNGHCHSTSTFNSEETTMKTLLGIDERTLVVLTACRLAEYKGIFRYLKAAILCQTRNAVFLLAGDGELRTPAENIIRENGLNTRIRLLGHVTDIERIYAISDVVALCSDAEAQPYVLLEAMRAKRPIVATAVTGNEELISNERTGLLVNSNPESIADAVDELLASREKRDKYAENAYVHFCEHFTLDKQISELIEIYGSFISMTGILE
jgi:glycosyltransferase involved in cell wall biosynthesis